MSAFWDFFSSGKGFQLGGSILSGMAALDDINTGLASTYSKVRGMYNQASSNMYQANVQDVFTALEDESFRTGITKALSKQSVSFSGRGISGGVSADEIRRSSRESLERQRAAKHLVGSTRSMALRRQAEMLIQEGRTASSYAQKQARRASINTSLSTGINIASLFV